MRSTQPRRPRILPGAVALGALVVAAIAPGCGTGSTHKTSGPTTTLVKVDRWIAPSVPMTPGTEGYCTSVVSIYRHLASLPLAANHRVRVDMVRDYLGEVPTMIATAPPPVADDSKLYFTIVAQILGDLQKAGLNPKRLSDPNLSRLLLDPQIKAAGDRVIGFVKANCNYLIGG